MREKDSPNHSPRLYRWAVVFSAPEDRMFFKPEGFLGVAFAIRGGRRRRRRKKREERKKGAEAGPSGSIVPR